MIFYLKSFPFILVTALLVTSGALSAPASASVGSCKVGGVRGKTVFTAESVRVVRIPLKHPNTDGKYKNYICSKFRSKPIANGARYGSKPSNCGSYSYNCPPSNYTLAGRFLAYEVVQGGGEGGDYMQIKLLDLKKAKSKTALDTSELGGVFPVDLVVRENGSMLIHGQTEIYFYRYKKGRSNKTSQLLVSSPGYPASTDSGEIPSSGDKQVSQLAFGGKLQSPTVEADTSNGRLSLSVYGQLSAIKGCKATKSNGVAPNNISILNSVGAIYNRDHKTKACIFSTKKLIGLPRCRSDAANVYLALNALSAFYACRNYSGSNRPTTIYKVEINSGTVVELLTVADPDGTGKNKSTSTGSGICSAIHSNNTDTVIVWIGCDNTLHRFDQQTNTDQILDSEVGWKKTTVLPLKDLRVADGNISWSHTQKDLKTVEQKSYPLEG